MNIKKNVFIGIMLLLSYPGKAQPYLDIVNVKYSNSPNTGFINQNKNDVKLEYLGAGTNLPIQFKNKKDALIFSPFFEKWSSKISNNKREVYYGLGLPVSLSKEIPKSRWNILATIILRMNDEQIDKNGKMQFGGAFIAGNKKSEKLTYKLGCYINIDLFGVFVMPLVGLDWRIDQRNNLFGVLPGNLTYEHKWNKYFYGGADFRAITNSYAKENGYWRIDENQLGLYIDSYFNKNTVLTVEAGHSVLRKIRTGIKHFSKYDAGVNDNFFFRVSFAYRVRFSKSN